MPVSRYHCGEQLAQMNDVVRRKNTLRARLKEQRESLSPSQVEQKSATVLDRLKNLPEFSRAHSIHTYASWRNEVRTLGLITDLLAADLEVVVPRVNLDRRVLEHHRLADVADLRPGAFGIPEPQTEAIENDILSCLDLVLVPGVGFDLSGHRLGYGGGYYDGFLRQTPAFRVALAYDFQVIERLPRRPEDEVMDVIVTEARVLRFDTGRRQAQG